MRIASYAIMMLLVFASPASTQENKTELPGNVKQTIDRFSGRETTMRTGQMKTMVAFVANICDLDERQTKQLELASKIAVEQSLSTHRRLLTTLMINRQR